MTILFPLLQQQI